MTISFLKNIIMKILVCVLLLTTASFAKGQQGAEESILSLIQSSNGKSVEISIEDLVELLSLKNPLPVNSLENKQSIKSPEAQFGPTYTLKPPVSSFLEENDPSSAKPSVTLRTLQKPIWNTKKSSYTKRILNKPAEVSVPQPYSTVYNRPTSVQVSDTVIKNEDRSSLTKDSQPDPDQIKKQLPQTATRYITVPVNLLIALEVPVTNKDEASESGGDVMPTLEPVEKEQEPVVPPVVEEQSEVAPQENENNENETSLQYVERDTRANSPIWIQQQAAPQQSTKNQNDILVRYLVRNIRGDNPTWFQQQAVPQPNVKSQHNVPLRYVVRNVRADRPTWYQQQAYNQQYSPLLY